MIYIKFTNKDNASDDTELSRMYCTDSYSVTLPEENKLTPTLRVYYRPGLYEEITEGEWLNCFILSESGETIDAYHSPKGGV